MHLFYSPGIKDTQVLEETESHHAVKVLRLKAGDKISVMDGTGGRYVAVIEKADAKKCALTILEEIQVPKRNFQIHVAIAPTKNIDRMEWFTEKSVEFGIEEITFMDCKRSERSRLNLERIEKIAVSAMKQSKNLYFPKINPLTDFKKVVADAKADQKFIGHLVESEKKHLLQVANKASKYLVLIGPEGDFTEEEIDIAIKFGFYPITLGESTLRTETAGIASCHILNLVNLKVN